MATAGTQAIALGNLFDIGCVIAPVDSQTAAMTGKRTAMANYGGIAFVVFKGAGSGTDEPVITLRQHTAYTAGTSADLVGVTKYYTKQEATLDNDEAWVETTQAVAAAVTVSPASAQKQAIIVIEVLATQLDDTYTHVSIDIADTGAAGAQLIAALAVPFYLKAARKPANLFNMLNPGAANV